MGHVRACIHVLIYMYRDKLKLFTRVFKVVISSAEMQSRRNYLWEEKEEVSLRKKKPS